MARKNKNNGTWSRYIQDEIAAHPIRTMSFPEEITELAVAPGSTNTEDPSYDPDLEDSLVPIGLDPGTYARQKESHTRGNDMLMGFNDLSKASSSSMWSTDPNGVIGSSADDFSDPNDARQRGRDPLLTRSGMVQCYKCGKYVEPNRTVDYEAPDGTSALACKKPCVPFNAAGGRARRMDRFRSGS